MSTNDSSSSVEPEAARAIIDHQVQIIQKLNDEGVRVARLQVVAVGALLTGISVAVGAGAIEIGQFWPPQNLRDTLGLAPLVIGTGVWGWEIIRIPKTYSDLQLGSANDPQKYTAQIEQNKELIEKTETDIKRLHQLFAIGAFLFLIWLALLAL